MKLNESGNGYKSKGLFFTFFYSGSFGIETSALTFGSALTLGVINGDSTGTGIVHT